jgi:hypothetical protein
MNRTHLALAAACLSFAASAGSASAVGGPSPNASCAGTLVAFEAHIAPGFVGDELKAEAPHSAGALGAEIRGLAADHGGSPLACLDG